MDSVCKWFKDFKDDGKEICQGRIPAQIEVTIRVTISGFLGYVFGLGEFPSAIPSSQRALITMLSCNLSMLFPTLLFSVGGILFPAQIVVTALGLACATTVLACAAGVGLGFYVAMFGLIALIVSYTRFDKSTGALTTLLVMQMALNSQSIAEPAAENGLDFVKSLWTGGQFPDSLVGMCWIVLFITTGRILPPFRTARSMIANRVVPKCLEESAAVIDLNDKDLRARMSRKGDVNDDEKNEGKESKDETALEEVAYDDAALDDQYVTLTTELVKSKALLGNGSIAAMTAFEPRLLRCGPPECSWVVLKKLCIAADRSALSALALSDLWRDPNKLDENTQFSLIPVHAEAAALLMKCVDVLRSGGGRINFLDEKRDDNDDNNSSSARGDAGDYQTLMKDDIPIFFHHSSHVLAEATNEWVDVMGPPDFSDRTFFDEKARASWKPNLMPWIGASGFALVKGMYEGCRAVFNCHYWKTVFLPPHCNADRFAWCIKFTVGFTALVSMGVYWDAFAQLEVPVRDNGALPEGAHFAGWYLIAYAMSTTQTAEGTVKKGLLRLIGTVVGAFSGWLAITACGEDGIYGLIAWMTVFTAIPAYIGLPRGEKSRMGLDPDFGFGPGYFVMTQALVVTDVYIGAGGKNDIAVNRIVSNVVGIAMAIALATFPPQLYGGSSKWAQAIMAEEKQALAEALRLLLEHTRTDDSNTKSAIRLADKLEGMGLEKKARTCNLRGEANDFYKDSSRFHDFPLWKVDPKLKEILDRLEVIGSLVFTTYGFASHILRDKERRNEFLTDDESQIKIIEMLRQLGPESTDLEINKRCKDEEEVLSATLESKLYLHYTQRAWKTLQSIEEELALIKFGMC